jgi:hypothetical protein
MLLTSLLIVVIATAGCGSTSASSVPKFSGNTAVNVFLSSTADEQVNRFDIQLQSLTLTNQSGATVSLISSEQGLEFIHLNGGVEPLLTVNIPQGIYTAATAKIGTAEFTCVTLTPTGGLDTSIFAYGETPTDAVTVNLPSPITVTGQRMSLILDMLVAQSAAYSTCYDPYGQYAWSITPTFNLTAFPLAPQPTNAENGKVSSLDGKVASIDTATDSFQLSLPQDLNLPSITLSIASSGSTVFQGVSSLSGLTVDTLVDLDGSIKEDGSVLATRIAVLDPDTTNLSVQSGPLMQTNAQVPLMVAFGRRQQGYFYDTGRASIWLPFDYSSARFQISGQFANLQNLPFVPSFKASNMVDGQNVYVSSHAVTVTSNPYPPAATVTLVPQTINGTVAGSARSGNFTVYTVTLQPYSLFPQLAVQQGQSIRLTNPNDVQVYVDSNTQLLNAQALAPGGTLRFYGLVFNDNGTLRMDCSQINDGISPAPSNARAHFVTGQVRTVGSASAPGNAITTSIRAHEPVK